MPALCATHRVVRFEHRGHGGSPVPNGPYTIDELGADVVDDARSLRLCRASCLLGFLDRRHGGRWLAIIRARADRPSSSSCAPRRICRRPRAGGSGPPPSARRAHPRWSPTRCSAAGSPPRSPRRIQTSWPAMSRHDSPVSTSPRATPACCEAIARHGPASTGCPGIGAPTLVVAGRQDPSIPPEHGEAIALAVPGARFELLDPAAHLANVERADAVTSLIAEHLAAEPAEAAALSDEHPHADGMKVRRAVLGDEHVDTGRSSTTKFTAPFQVFVTRYAWGGSLDTGRAGPAHTQRHPHCWCLTRPWDENEIAMRCGPRCATAWTPEDRRGVHPHRHLRGRAGGQLRVRDRPEGDRRRVGARRPDRSADADSD